MCSTHTTHIRLHPISVSNIFKFVYTLEVVRLPMCRSIWCVCHFVICMLENVIEKHPTEICSKMFKMTSPNDVDDDFVISFFGMACNKNENVPFPPLSRSDSSASISLEKLNISIWFATVLFGMTCGNTHDFCFTFTQLEL